MRVVLAPGWGLPLQHARPFARPAPAPTPSLGPVAVVGPRPMEPLRPGCPGPLYASAELRPPGSGEPHRRRGHPPARGRPRGRRGAAACVGEGERGAADERWGARGECGDARGVVYGRSRPRPPLTPGCAAAPRSCRWRWWRRARRRPSCCSSMLGEADLQLAKADLQLLATTVPGMYARPCPIRAPRRARRACTGSLAPLASIALQRAAVTRLPAAQVPAIGASLRRAQLHGGARLAAGEAGRVPRLRAPELHRRPRCRGRLACSRSASGAARRARQPCISPCAR